MNPFTLFKLRDSSFCMERYVFFVCFFRILSNKSLSINFLNLVKVFGIFIFSAYSKTIFLNFKGVHLEKVLARHFKSWKILISWSAVNTGFRHKRGWFISEFCSLSRTVLKTIAWSFPTTLMNFPAFISFGCCRIFHSPLCFLNPSFAISTHLEFNKKHK